MWDTPDRDRVHLSHDPLCEVCEHAMHTYLPCSDTCPCVPPARATPNGWAGLAAA
jgi:hypothetical protein